jgi:hypothetical protein
MKAGSRLGPYVYEWVKHLVRLHREDWTPMQITNEVNRLCGKGSITRPTVVDIIAEIRRIDTTAPWSAIDADASPVVLAVLANLVKATGGGRKYLTRGEVEVLTRLASLVPDLDAWPLLLIAHAYQERQANARPTEDLDCLLAYAPWRPDARDDYDEARTAGLVAEPPMQVMAALFPEKTRGPVTVRGKDRDTGKRSVLKGRLVLPKPDLSVIEPAAKRSGGKS